MGLACSLFGNHRWEVVDECPHPFVRYKVSGATGIKIEGSEKHFEDARLSVQRCKRCGIERAQLHIPYETAEDFDLVITKVKIAEAKKQDKKEDK